jgi:hypothetical protein
MNWGYDLVGPRIAPRDTYGAPADSLIGWGALEFSYEEVGLPIDSLATDPRAGDDRRAGARAAMPGSEPLSRQDLSGWARVVYGYLSGDRLFGWVRLQPRYAVTLWPDALPTHVLFFADSIPFRIHATPGGDVVRFPLAYDPPGSNRVDYIMHPLETDGPWMRVRAVTPSDYCADPPTPRDTTGWIRYLDDASRPRVWYFTRGC